MIYFSYSIIVMVKIIKITNGKIQTLAWGVRHFEQYIIILCQSTHCVGNFTCYVGHYDLLYQRSSYIMYYVNSYYMYLIVDRYCVLYRHILYPNVLCTYCSGNLLVVFFYIGNQYIQTISVILAVTIYYIDRYKQLILYNQLLYTMFKVTSFLSALITYYVGSQYVLC